MQGSRSLYHYIKMLGQNNPTQIRSRLSNDAFEKMTSTGIGQAVIIYPEIYLENEKRNNFMLNYITVTRKICDILKYFDLNTITLYLWKRDMDNVFYKKNINLLYRYDYHSRFKNYKFVSDNDLITYLYKASKILPEFIEGDYKFSILTHIAITLIKKKYTKWKKHIKCLVINHNNNELKIILKNIRLSISPDEYNMEFLLIIEKEKQEYKLFFDNN